MSPQTSTHKCEIKNDHCLTAENQNKYLAEDYEKSSKAQALLYYGYGSINLLAYAHTSQSVDF